MNINIKKYTGTIEIKYDNEITKEKIDRAIDEIRTSFSKYNIFIPSEYEELGLASENCNGLIFLKYVGTDCTILQNIIIKAINKIAKNNMHLWKKINLFFKILEINESKPNYFKHIEIQIDFKNNKCIHKIRVVRYRKTLSNLRKTKNITCNLEIIDFHYSILQKIHSCSIELHQCLKSNLNENKFKGIKLYLENCKDILQML